MIALPAGVQVWLVAGATDMRKGFDGLAALVQMQLSEDPFSGQLFVFRGRAGDRVKILWWSGDGLCLFAKRLERGRFVWPQATHGSVSLTAAQLSMLLEGIDWVRRVPVQQRQRELHADGGAQCDAERAVRGIWMGGGAPAADSSNNLYVLTGNGQFDATNPTGSSNDYGDSLLQLSSSLVVQQYFTPADQANDDRSDQDFGSGGAAILADLPGEPVAHLIMGGGKDGGLYVLNRDSLGGLDGSPSQAVQQISLGHGLFVTGAYWDLGYYVAALDGPMTAFALNPAIPQFTQSSASTQTFGFPGSSPSVSANALSNGIVWTLDNSQYCTNQSHGCGPAVLYAYDASNVATELWDSSKATADQAGNAVKFTCRPLRMARYMSVHGETTQAGCMARQVCLGNSISTD